MLLPFHDDNPTRRIAVATLILIGVNTLIFLATLSLSFEQDLELTYRRGFVPARLGQLTDPRPLLVNVTLGAERDALGRPVLVQGRMELPADRGGIVLSLFTCMFLHGGWMHLIGNMWFLWIFGNNVEDRLGIPLYLVLYLTGGLVASGCHWMLDPQSTTPVIGASGAIACVLGAYAVTWPHARVRTLVFLLIFFTVVDLPALLVLGVWFLTQLLEATKQMDLNMGGGVAWWAHVGGFVAGLALMPIFRSFVEPELPPELVEEVEVI